MIRNLNRIAIIILIVLTFSTNALAWSRKTHIFIAQEVGIRNAEVNKPSKKCRVLISSLDLRLNVVHIIEMTPAELKEPVLFMPEEDIISNLAPNEYVRINLPFKLGHLLFSIIDVKTSTKFKMGKHIYYPEIGMKYLWLKLILINNSYTQIPTFTPNVFVERAMPRNPSELWAKKQIFEKQPTIYETDYDEYRNTPFSSFATQDEFELDYYIKPNSRDDAWIIYEIPYDTKMVKVRWWLIKNKVVSWNIEIL